MIKQLILTVLLLPTLALAQHSIKGTFQPKENFAFAILYRVSPTTSIYVANSEVKKEDGSFEFKLDSTAIPSTYRIVYGLPQEDNNFDLIYSGKEDVVVDLILDKGVVFNASKENKVLNSYKNSMAQLAKKIQHYYASKNTNEKEYKSIIFDLKEVQKQFEKAAQGTMALDYIKASKPYVPEAYEDPKTFSANVKNNYFSSIDFSNKTLQNSNFLIEATINYVFKFIDRKNETASIKENVDTVMAKIGNNTPEIKRVLLEILYKQLISGGNENAANYVGTTYLLPIAKAENNQKMVNQITYFKASSLGETAPNFTVEIPNSKGKIDLKKMHDLDVAEDYLIVFWSTACSHCLEELPQLKEYAKTIDKKKLKVIAIGLENEIYRWKEMTANFPDFINVYGEGKWDNPIGDSYNVTGTPTYFVLDSAKKIIKKPEDFTAFKAYYNTVLENYQQEQAEKKIKETKNKLEEIKKKLENAKQKVEDDNKKDAPK